MAFRDQDLSDRIGFRYAHMPESAAVDDFVGAVKHIGRDGGAAFVFLDGGKAAAMSVVLFFIIAAITLVQFRLYRSRAYG